MAATYVKNLTAWWSRLSRPAEPPTFEVRCVCGTAAQGVRSNAWQTVRCLSCGQEVFILPASMLPLPAPPASHAAAPHSARPAYFTRKRFETWLALASLFFRRYITLPRAIIAGVAVLVLATMLWTWQASRERSFAGTLPEGLRAGQEALDQGDLVAACRHLAEADRAARGLARGTAQERTARQLYQEAQHWSSLSHIGLDEMFAAAEQAVAAGREQRFADDFARKYGRRAVVIDGWVDLERSQAPMLDFVRQSDSNPGRISLEGLPWLASLPQGPSRVIFMGEPDKIVRSAADPRELLLTFKPETCILATHSGSLRRQGWPMDAELETTLAQQRQWLGVDAVSGERLPDTRPAPVAQKGNARGIVPGDQEGDVLAQLRKPDRVARVGIFNRIDEQWIYDGLSRLYVNLARPTTGAPAKVTAVNTGPKP